MATVTSLALAAAFGCLLVQNADGKPQAPARDASISKDELGRANKECPPGGWLMSRGDFCYKLSDEALSWFDANAGGCEKLAPGAHLASITYANKASLSKEKNILESDYYWVGLRSGDTEWNQGTSFAEKVDFTNWEKIRFSEPSGSSLTNDDCVLMIGDAAPDDFKPAGSWMDWSCNDEVSFLCELKQNFSDECPENWTKHNGVCYMLHHPAMSFADAESFCSGVQQGSTLAAVPDYAALAQSITFDAAYIWIGLRSTPDDQGHLHWLNDDGEEVVRTNWKYISYEEPNSAANGPNSDCVMVNGLYSEETFATGEWGDYYCDTKSRFLCVLEI